ncbi:MAG TPA: IS4 family transposase [Thermomicrobiales bacterium]|jgi:hypothetical protein|nr:IS4 family transposase [Thermomicrobiales bacterium]
MSPAAWAGAEVGGASRGDRRRTRRLVMLLSEAAARPDTGLAAACASPAATKAAYRFLANDAIAAEDILAAHVATTIERLGAEPLILALQDTTALDCSAHPALAGAGPLAHPHQTGLWVHSVRAVSSDGVPLGLLHQHRGARDPAKLGQHHQRRQRPTAAKESQRWLDAQAATAAVVPAAVAVVTVADREADIFDLFAQDRPPQHDLLIRAVHNRRIREETRSLWTAARAAPGGEVAPGAVGRGGERPPREALLLVRWTAVTLEPPRHRSDRAALAPAPVTAILAEEPVPPAGAPPICGLLLTTRPVANGEAALGCVRWYAQRWRVERLHYTLKSGCQIEARQLRATTRLERALAVYAIVAWRLLWLTYLGRAELEQPCTAALTATEWQVLFRTRYPAPPLPAPPPPLGQAVRWLARLGGIHDRVGDGPPGVKVLWRGWRRLDDLVFGWRLAHNLSPNPLSLRVVGNA